MTRPAENLSRKGRGFHRVLRLALTVAISMVAPWPAVSEAESPRLLPSVMGQSAGAILERPGLFRALLRRLVTPDPVFIKQAKLTAVDGDEPDLFGTSVSISGDTVVVGVPEGNLGFSDLGGAAYVFVRNGTSWSQQQKLAPPEGLLGFFGNSVAVSGSTVVVGDAKLDQGQKAAYVFVRDGVSWSGQATLTGEAESGGASSAFGDSVAISGDTIVVGDQLEGSGGFPDLDQWRGSAYVFVRDGTSWSLQQKLTASDGVAKDLFGYRVAISGDTLVVAAPGADAAYVFVRDGTSWSQQQKLTAASLGSSVAIRADTVVVGAVGDDIGPNVNQGSAYVFVRDGDAWSQQAKLTASDGAPQDWFGYSVAISGNTVVIGAYRDNVGGWLDRGSAYVFTRDGTSWSQLQKLTASDGVFADHFGRSVAISGNYAVVGAPQDDIGANGNQGSAYIFHRELPIAP